jgi:cytochrome c-type biogenesis protein CcmH
MSRQGGWAAMGIMIVLCAVALLAYGSPSRPLSLDARARAIEVQLRCPVCQGESVADSPADISTAIRADVRRRLAAGQSAQAIEAFYVSKYGPHVLLAPPSTGVGSFAWLAPPLLILGGAALLITLIRQWRSSGRPPAEPAPAYETYLERVRKELAAELAER